MASLSDSTSSAGIESRSVRGLGGRVLLSSVLWKRMPRLRREADVCGVLRGLRSRAEGAWKRERCRPGLLRRVCCEARVRERRAVDAFIARDGCFGGMREVK